MQTLSILYVLKQKQQDSNATLEGFYQWKGLFYQYLDSLFLKNYPMWAGRLLTVLREVQNALEGL